MCIRDSLHTLNTMDHVSLMAPHLSQTTCEVDVPMCAGGAAHSYEGVAVQDWSPAQVLEWLATAEDGRFSHVVVPPEMDGRGLLGMNARRMTEMVESGHGEGRAEGEAWYVSTQARVGRALFLALRDAQRDAPVFKRGP